jgi:hypothetical protein
MKAAHRRGLVVSAGLVSVLAATAGTALANDCANFSRAAPACASTQAGCGFFYTVGNWLWLPSVDPGAPPIWGFMPPANFTNGQSGALTALANDKSGGAVCATPHRQPTSLDNLHGVLSTEACGFGP